MNDILPGEVETWQFLEQSAREVFGLYGFSEIRTPVPEKTELFCRSIGETTDIVEKEMYTFNDKSENSLTLRPEGTAPAMRAFIQNRLHTLDPVSKLYYMGPMFRYERPQKGRYRQFHQLGVEVVGVEDAKIDAQVLAMLHQYFVRIGIDSVSLQINSLGCPECRPGYRQKLITYLESRLNNLCADCQRRYQTNPLRVLDCKAQGCQAATVAAPAVIEHLCSPCNDHFIQVQSYLQALAIPFEVNARMVRGLDYYVRTTFELVTDQLGAQNAVAAGGRYDGLVESLGGPALPGIGFAIGFERLVLLKGEQRVAAAVPQLFIAAIGVEAADRAFVLMSQLQAAGVRAEMDYLGKSLKAQMRRANKLRAAFTLILGEAELQSGQAQLKDMAASSQSTVRLDGLVGLLIKKLGEIATSS
ncbi:MAG: histidine--tRNA ligase [Thermodesulfobacteriota bacterium]|nr:histidine--tRNA ligase [Thermodesulfobacteriota bacterium]